MVGDEGNSQLTPEPKERTAERDEPVLPDVSSDELDVGWGDEPAERDDEWYRRERPPHHG
ncbi:MAG: hypothetical protein QOC66_1309 [Pseudonocardiales bacterium]|jgi:hypothetical protein|nr:hypothetical protein [Pseudonocardiales bacterium]